MKAKYRDYKIFDSFKYRSSHRRFSIRKGVLRNFAKFRGKYLCQSLLFNKFAGLRPGILFKKGLWHRWFPVSFAKFLNTIFTEYLRATASASNLFWMNFQWKFLTYIAIVSINTSKYMRQNFRKIFFV